MHMTVIYLTLAELQLKLYFNCEDSLIDFGRNFCSKFKYKNNHNKQINNINVD